MVNDLDLIFPFPLRKLARTTPALLTLLFDNQMGCLASSNYEELAF